MLFLANIQNIAAIIIFIIFVKNGSSYLSFNPIYIFIAIILNLYIYKVTFEFQRISLTVGRISKLTKQNQKQITEIQMWLTPSWIGMAIFLCSMLDGFIAAYIFVVYWPILVLYFFVKFLPISFIPIPYHFLFSELLKANENHRGDRLKNVFSGNFSEATINLMTYMELNSILNEIPKDKTYEKWALNKFGRDLFNA